MAGCFFLKTDNLLQKSAAIVFVHDPRPMLNSVAINLHHENCEIEAISHAIEGRIRRGGVTDESDLSTK
jgi:hypothetical protein